MKRDEPTKSETLIFQNYAVAFLDLVGQRDDLRRLVRIPTTPEEERAFLETARQSVGKVLELRRDFASFFDSYNRRKDQGPDLSTIPVEHHENILATMRTEYVVSGLSDSIVVAVPLGANDEYCKAMNGLKVTILSICYLAASTYAIGMVFRGGLDIGMGTMIGLNEVYGPALVRAYQLENEVAEYPRFVVGDKLLEFLQTVTNQDPKTKPGELATLNAARCRRMIVQDTDGRLMLDFLGTEVRTALSGSPSAEVIGKGHDFVESEYKRFRASGNEKLASRYFRLLQYYLARK
jgi:hypothetical protein